MPLSTFFLSETHTSVAKRPVVGQCSDMTKRLLTPNNAAKHAGVSRSAINRGLANKSLRGTRNNSNRWLIELSDLEAWMATRPEQDRVYSATDRPVTDPVQAEQSDAEKISDLKELLAIAHAENEGIRARLADTQAERDRLASLLEKALDRQQPSGFWSRLFGR